MILKEEQVKTLAYKFCDQLSRMSGELMSDACTEEAGSPRQRINNILEAAYWQIKDIGNNIIVL